MVFKKLFKNEKWIQKNSIFKGKKKLLKLITYNRLSLLNF